MKEPKELSPSDDRQILPRGGKTRRGPLRVPSFDPVGIPDKTKGRESLVTRNGYKPLKF